MKLRYLGAWVAAASLCFVLSGGVTGAGAAPYLSAGITLSDSHPAAGGSDTVTASGYQPGSTATFLIFSNGITLATATVDANGVVTDTVTVPSSFTPGSQHTFEVQGSASDGSPLNQSATVTLQSTVTSAGNLSNSSPLQSTVTSAGNLSNSSPLAFTGARIAELSALGLIVIALGVILIIVARRRRASHT